MVDGGGLENRNGRFSKLGILRLNSARYARYRLVISSRPVVSRPPCADPIVTPAVRRWKLTCSEGCSRTVRWIIS